MELRAFKDDPSLRVLRPMVEAYLAFARADNRHIRALRLTPSQFDVITALGGTEGLACSELSDAALVTKGTLTGVLDRLETKGLIRREPLASDRRAVKIRLTAKGDGWYRKTFAAHAAFLRPFFERALTRTEAEQATRLFSQIRDSFHQR